MTNSITEYRQEYKPKGGFEFPEYYERFQTGWSSLWRGYEAQQESDVRDWKSISEEERKLIGGILKGFTQLECVIGDYWSEEVCSLFPKQEIIGMARLYSLNEWVHAEAYNLLSDTLGINEFEEFLGDPIAQEKLRQYSDYKGKIALGIFSGAGEGVSLFSSFAILLSFSLQGKFKGLSQIISWSIADEQRHSDAACSLFRQLVREKGITEEEINLIFEGFKAVIDNEFAFLGNSIGDREYNGVITMENMKHFIWMLANNRIRTLGLYSPDRYFPYDPKKAYIISTWFDQMAKGNVSHDFFSLAKEGSSYVAKPKQNWKAINLETINLQLV